MNKVYINCLSSFLPNESVDNEHIEDFLGKDKQKPLDFARDEIKEILINLKRVEFINKVKEDLYQRASDRNKIIYYYLNSDE